MDRLGMRIVGGVVVGDHQFDVVHDQPEHLVEVGEQTLVGRRTRSQGRVSGEDGGAQGVGEGGVGEDQLAWREGARACLADPGADPEEGRLKPQRAAVCQAAVAPRTTG